MNLEEIIKNAFKAGMIFSVGGHKAFKQIHPNLKEYIKKLKDDKILLCSEK